MLKPGAIPKHLHAKQVHLAYRLDINEFRGKQSLQLMVEQLSLADLSH
ncbi:hypothetical protein [Thalassomonas haliotis]